ncbi:MAG: hypothetical protein R2747_09925 [Pyrinomonadaceae bacterium]
MKSTLFLIIFLLSTAPVFGQDFDYLKIEKNKIKTTHQAKFIIEIDNTFDFLGEFRHQPTYGEKQFNVSFAAYRNGENLIMIHAETHTDGSGGLDYSELQPAVLNGLKFTAREQCATAEDEAEMKANPQIQFLEKAGFEIKLPFYLQQYFATSPDGKAEVVISYGRKIPSCDSITDDFRNQIRREISENIRVRNS